VDVDPASRRPGPSSTAVATLDAHGQARYEFDLHWDCGPLSLDPATPWLHTGSIATVRPPGAAEVERLLAHAAARGVPTSIDLNVREPLPWDLRTARRHLLRLAGHATVVKASIDDLALLDPGRDPVQAARDWLAGARTRLVVLTLGARGAWASTGADDIEAAAPVVRLVDTVGAGDAFMAALIDGLLAHPAPLHWEPQRLEAALRRACVAAAICCEREGADPPTQADLATRLP
jgi:fructokinase